MNNFGPSHVASYIHNSSKDKNIKAIVIENEISIKDLENSKEKYYGRKR